MIVTAIIIRNEHKRMVQEVLYKLGNKLSRVIFESKRNDGGQINRCRLDTEEGMSLDQRGEKSYQGRKWSWGRQDPLCLGVREHRGSCKSKVGGLP